ncbi:MAG: hypothetical protein HND48_17770 [Chloroflexi bacterium]|nr:hypothetical protein [Chloroflexota bacterium]
MLGVKLDDRNVIEPDLLRSARTRQWGSGRLVGSARLIGLSRLCYVHPAQSARSRNSRCMRRPFISAGFSAESFRRYSTGTARVMRAAVSSPVCGLLAIRLADWR